MVYNLKAREAIFQIPTYVPGKPIEEVQRELGLKKVIKLASNENPLGPSPKALAALQQNLSEVHLYPDGRSYVLKNKLAEKTGLSPEHFLIGNGSDENIKLLAETFLEPGEEVVFCTPTFGEYAFATRLMGGICRTVPTKNFTYDLTGMLTEVTEKTRLVFICNPNNPTGTIVSHGELESFLEALPPGVVVVIDEAYREYVTDPSYPDSLAWVREGRPVVVLRTFSKIYGLAGLRVGYAIAAPEIIQLVQKVREPFNVNRLAQVAATAALEDEEHLSKSRKVNNEGKVFLTQELTGMGFRVLSTEANFLFVHLRQDSRPIFEALLREGVIIRTGEIFGYPDWIRVTIGTPEENRLFLEALQRVVPQIRG